MDAYSDINSINDIWKLELLRVHLAHKAHAAELSWPDRLKMYKQIESIIERITFLEK